MNTRLKDAAIVSITPFPKKYRFEGVDYSQGSKDLLIYGFPLMLGIFTAITLAPEIADKCRDLKRKFQNHKK